MLHADGSNSRGALFALAAYAIFATHDVLVKFLGSHYAAFQIIFYSVLLSFPMVVFMLMRDPTSGNLRPRHPWWTALRTLAAVLTGVGAFYAFSVLPLAQVYAILFASPLLITVLSIPILGERVGRYRWGAVVAGLVGVLIVLRPGALPLELGHAAALMAAIGAATGSVVVRKIGRDERDAVLLLYPMVANFVLMACLLPFVYEPLPVEHLGVLGMVSLLGFAAGLCLIVAYRAADAAVVAPMQYSQIVWAAIYGLMFFGERPDRYILLGAGIIILSGLYILLRESRGRSAHSPVLRAKARPETGTTPRVAALRGVPGRAQDPLAKR